MLAVSCAAATLHALTQRPKTRDPRPEIRDPRSELRAPSSELRDKRPEIRDPRSELRAPRQETRDPRSEIRNQRSEVRDPRSEIRDPRSETRDPRSEIRNQRSEVRDPRSEIRDPPLPCRAWQGTRVTCACLRQWLTLLPAASALLPLGGLSPQGLLVACYDTGDSNLTLQQALLREETWPQLARRSAPLRAAPRTCPY